jgi:hypothetical protein
MNVCMYVLCMYACMHVCVCTYVCMSVLVCTHFWLSEIEQCDKNFTKILMKSVYQVPTNGVAPYRCIGCDSFKPVLVNHCIIESSSSSLICHLIICNMKIVRRIRQNAHSGKSDDSHVVSIVFRSSDMSSSLSSLKEMHCFSIMFGIL